MVWRVERRESRSGRLPTCGSTDTSGASPPSPNSAAGAGIDGPAPASEGAPEDESTVTLWEDEEPSSEGIAGREPSVSTLRYAEPLVAADGRVAPLTSLPPCAAAHDTDVA